MTSFLNENTSDLLQQLAVFVELAGFLLIILELYFPKRADAFEAFVDETAEMTISRQDFERKRVWIFLTTIIDLVE